jgi:type I restriction enzyme S subunit
MKGEWNTMQLEDCMAAIIDYRGKTPTKTTYGVPLVTAKVIKGGRIETPDEFIAESDYESWMRRGMPKHGDIVMTTEAPLGEVAQLDGLRIALAQRVITLRGKSDLLDNTFLKFLMQSEEVQEELRSRATGTTVLGIRQSELRKVSLTLPPLAEQKAIAAVLGALDDKIELNRRINATLEAMARALFQSWFVDFDPVRAKLDGRQPPNLDPATAALFPDSFQDSVLGHIPTGWKVGTLDELTSFVIGGDWGATEPTEDESVSCYCIRGADIPSLQEGGVGKMPTRFLKPSSVEKRQLMDGDLAIEISGGSPTQCTGRPVLVSDGLLRSLGRPLVASNFCRIVKLKSPAFSKFVYCWLRSLYDADSLFQFETGTTGIKNFAFVLFSEKYPLVVPDPRITEAFDHAVSPLFARIQANAHQSRTLATLRDTLLPKLLRGELSVAKTAV